jgi:hypothetical protein
MATTTNITTTYAGEKLQGFISAATLSADTIERGGVEVKPNIKFKSVIKTLASSDDLVADGSCDFAATSTLTLDERYLEPKEFQVNLQLCKQDYRDDWDALSMGISAHDSLPPAFSDYLMGHVVAKVAEKIEKTIWQGDDTANEGEFDGLVELATNDTNVVDVTGVAGGVTSSNVIAELGKVVDAIPTEIYNKEDLHIYIAPNVARAYIRAQAALGYKDLYHVGKTELDFEGIKLFIANGMADGFMMAAQSSNLYFGTGLLSDKNEAKVIDMSDIDGSQNVRVVLRYTATVNYGIGEEIVLYTPTA